MSLNILYRDWRVQPSRGLGGGGGVLAGTLCEFDLEGSRPSGMPRSNDPHVQPAQLVGVRPTATVPYGRQHAPDRPGLEAVPRHGIVTSSPLPPATSHYRLGFIGGGISAGFPLSATISFSFDPSFGGRLRMFDTTMGEGRTAASFRGDGMILDGSFGGVRVTTGQILLLNYGWNIAGGVVDVARRIENAVRGVGRGGAWDAICSMLPPISSIAFVAGYSTGGAAGLTMFTGEFVVNE